MPDTTPPSSEVPAAEQQPPIVEQPPTIEEPPEQMATREEQPSIEVAQQEVSLEEGIEEELIIEDFTIDGICGVY